MRHRGAAVHRCGRVCRNLEAAERREVGRERGGGVYGPRQALHDCTALESDLSVASATLAPSVAALTL